MGSVRIDVPPEGRTALVTMAEQPAWKGTIELLTVSPVLADSLENLRIDRLSVSAAAEGKPYLYIRSMATERAKLRTGREERLIACIKNLGADADLDADVLAITVADNDAFICIDMDPQFPPVGPVDAVMRPHPRRQVPPVELRRPAGRPMPRGLGV